MEKIGISRAREKLGNADLVLYVVDSSEKPDENDEEIIRMLKGRNAVILLNKSDMETVTTREMIEEMIVRVNGCYNGKASEKDEGSGNCGYPVLCVSALEGTGIGLLEDRLKEMFYQGAVTSDNEVCITNMRHKTLLMDAEESLERVQESISLGMPEDFLTIDLMGACEALGNITGEASPEDMINEIFGKFCLGK